jgi:hypothetical protein
MQYFYDGQVRRYVTQIVRAFSNFSYKDGDGDLRQVPVTYGDLTRQVASIMKDNSENKIPSAPRMAVYITGLEMDRSRTSDSSFVSKVNLREKKFDEATSSYLQEQAKGYTVERLHPSPFTLSVNVDLWSTSTDQKLQLLEQILMLFNPSLEFQTNDNYVDWTSLTTLFMENIEFSSRTVPVGTESEIDICTMGFTTPIYISPPTKVKKLGIITKIITGIVNSDTGDLELDGFTPDPDSEAALTPEGLLPGQSTGSTGLGTTLNPVINSYRNYGVNINDEIALLATNKLLHLPDVHWLDVIEAELPSQYEPGITQIELRRSYFTTNVRGTITVNNNNTTELLINYDEDTLPSNTLIEGPARNAAQYGTIDYIINPRTFNPTSVKVPGVRILVLDAIGNATSRNVVISGTTNRIDTYVDYYINEITKPSNVNSGTAFPGSPNVGDLFYRTDEEKLYFYQQSWWLADKVTSAEVTVNGETVSATIENIGEQVSLMLASNISPDDKVQYTLHYNDDGADAWKNSNNTDFFADQNDIVEWTGSKWTIVYDASEYTTPVFTTNLTTGVQYVYSDNMWVESIDGYYPKGTWNILL